MSHTPTPWNSDGADIKTPCGTLIASTMDAGFLPNSTDDDNASHIVHCVNLYPDLIVALGMAEGFISEVDSDSLTLKIIRETIKKAGLK